MALEVPSVYLIFEPYWNPGVKYKRTYLTNILTSMTGKEQRSGLKTIPVHALDYTIVTKGYEQTSRLKRYLKAYLPYIWGIPVWVQGMVLTSSVIAGATTLPVESTSGRELDLFDYIIIKSTKGLAYYYDCIEVDSFTETSIELVSGLLFNWSSGTKVYPMMRAELGDAQPLELPTLEHFTCKFQFIESFVENSVALPTIPDSGSGVGGGGSVGGGVGEDGGSGVSGTAITNPATLAEGAGQPWPGLYFGVGTKRYYTFTVPSGARYIRANIANYDQNDVVDLMLEKGEAVDYYDAVRAQIGYRMQYSQHTILINGNTTVWTAYNWSPYGSQIIIYNPIPGTYYYIVKAYSACHMAVGLGIG